MKKHRFLLIVLISEFPSQQENTLNRMLYSVLKYLRVVQKLQQIYIFSKHGYLINASVMWCVWNRQYLATKKAQNAREPPVNADVMNSCS